MSSMVNEVGVGGERVGGSFGSSNLAIVDDGGLEAHDGRRMIL
jgi:hypothetical protein